MDLFRFNWKIIGLLLGVVSIVASITFSLILLFGVYYHLVTIILGAFGVNLACSIIWVRAILQQKPSALLISLNWWILLSFCLLLTLMFLNNKFNDSTIFFITIFLIGFNFAAVMSYISMKEAIGDTLE
ncbi:uncharacterized protein LOC116348045 [Contarinia nasturtii]|uniref:uncharacterized protein LOC116348045 n=1 Tax=Contarinia nasturtii TaxID=265458 RepID=UPI0012D43654|nr:uncharacterized protein LOC116348045 [Contarinia nasturtii]